MHAFANKHDASMLQFSSEGPHSNEGSKALDFSHIDDLDGVQSLHLDLGR